MIQTNLVGWGASVQAGFLLGAAGAALMPLPLARGAAALAVVTAGLAIAAARAASWPFPAGFVAVDAALLIVAVVLGAVAVVMTLRRTTEALAVAGSLVLALGSVSLLWAGREQLLAVSLRGLASAMLIVAAVVVVLALLVRVAGREPSAAMTPIRHPAMIGLVLGAVAMAGPHLALVVAGLVLAAWSGWWLARAVGLTRIPAAPLLTLVLVPACWFFWTIAGPESLRIASLPELPLSPAAELLLAPALLLAAWALAGLWPLHRQEPGALTAAVGLLLLARVALPAVPEGVDHWRPIAMPVVVIGLWHAALTRRWSLVAVAMAWVGMLAPAPGGPGGAGLLVAAALLLEAAVRLGPDHARATLIVRLVAALAGSWGALLAASAGLHGEVVYTVVAVTGVAAAAVALTPLRGGPIFRGPSG
ncbi:MAG TPA: hypothetical protein VF046_01085 [Gemmatimonadales bacterium]